MKKVAILTGSFHTREMEIMLEEAYKTAMQVGLEIVIEVRVPGSMEKPLALKRIFEQTEVEGVIILGIIEKGETQHGLVMGQCVYQSLVNLQLEYNRPIGMGILGPGIEPEQIEPRIRPYARAAVVALAEMLK